jgi:hypothetical protein
VHVSLWFDGFSKTEQTNAHPDQEAEHYQGGGLFIVHPW